MLLRLAVRNALRNRRRTGLTGATVTLGCALLTIGLSWVVGIQGSFIDASIQANGHAQLTTDVYARRQALLPLQENLTPLAPILQMLHTEPSVRTAYPRITLPVTASVEGELGEIFGVLTGAPLEYYDQILDLPSRITAGRTFSTAPDAEALIGRLLARDMNVRPGEEAIFLGRTQDGSFAPVRVTVAGIVDTGNGRFDRQVFVPLDAAQWMADIPGGATEILLFGTGRGSAAEIAQALGERLEQIAEDIELRDAQGEPAGITLTTWDTREPFASLLQTARVLMAAVAGIIVLTTALGVLNTMLMSVLERTHEIGVLRAMGMTTPSVVLIFIVEAVTIAVVGGAVGALLGSIVSVSMETVGVDLGTAAANLPDTVPANRILHPDWRPMIAMVSFGLGVVVALLGAAIPALKAAAVPPATAMRARR
ncbi:MAG: FtsX-like permease family protein [Myxococcota bacterium]